MAKKMFPPNLDLNCKIPSKGEAVDFLEEHLRNHGFIPKILMTQPDKITQAERVTAGVTALQIYLGFEDPKDRDGNYGPGTRELHKKKMGFDADAVESRGEGTHWAGPNHDGLKRWPEISLPKI